MKLSTLVRQSPRPSLDSVNTGLTSPTPLYMLWTFGRPGALTDDCSEPDPVFASNIVTEDVGPIRVTGHRVAVLSLRHVFDDVAAAGRMDLYDNVRCSGMLCVRKVRGGAGFSNHAFGTAVDLYFGDDPDAEQMGDGKVQRGLVELYPFFHRRKWFAGMGYKNREDGMHMEASVELIQTWKALGLI